MNNKIKPWIYTVLIGIILLIVFKYDASIALFFNSLRNPVLDSIMLVIEKLSTPAIILVPAFFAFRGKQFKNWTISILSAYILTLAIKLAVQRLRPFNLPGINTPPGLIDPKFSKWDFSFPSNHASTVFSSWFFIPGGAYRACWLAISLIIVFSRIYFGLHYLSDLIVGSLIGLGMSYLLSRYSGKYLDVKFLDKFRYKRFKK